MKTKRYKFQDIVLGETGLLKGPFGSDLKKSLYVPKSNKTYKVYLQENILKKDKSKGKHYISDEYFNSKMSRYQVSNGDFIITCDGTLGEIYQLKDINEDGIISSSLLRITLDSKLVDDDFFFYFWTNNIKVPLIKSHDNSVLKHLPGVKAIREFEFDLPYLHEQQKIASILSTLDKKIALNNQINQELEAMAKTLYDYWFVQFDFPNKEGKPYKNSGGKMVYSEKLKREIPEGWEVEELSELISIDRGISYKSSDITNVGIPMINLNSFYLDGSYKHEGIKYFSSKYNDNKIVQINDLLIATTDVTRNADIIGKAILIPDIFENDILMSCDIARVTTGDKIDKYYLEMLFNSDYYHNYIKGFASGTLVLHLNMNGIGWFKTVIPPTKLLNRFSSLKKNIEKKKNIILKENQKLTQLRDWLLPMLMNGQVSVADATEQIDELMVAEPVVGYGES